MTVRFLAAALLCAATATADEPPTHEKKGFFAGIDFTPDELVGFGHGPWQVERYVGKSSRSLGAMDARDNGMMIGGGFGYRLQLAAPHGLRFALDVGYGWGRLIGGDLPWATGSGSYFNIGAAIGYQVRFGPVVLHTATWVGGEFIGADIADGARLPDAVQAALSSQPAAENATMSASRQTFRLGQEVGVHVAVERPMYVWADGRVDIDGEWRVRLGIGFATDDFFCANCPPRGRRGAPAPAPVPVQVNVAPQSIANIQVHSDGDAQVQVNADAGATVNLGVQAGGDVHLHVDPETLRLMDEAIGAPPPPQP